MGSHIQHGSQDWEAIMLNPKCSRCSYSTAPDACRPGAGYTDTAKYMILRDKPTENDAEFYLRFRAALEKTRLDPKLFYVTTVIKCPTDKYVLSEKNMQACKYYLDQEINKIKPEKVLVMGKGGITLLTKPTDDPVNTLIRNRRRWWVTESGITFDTWMEKNKNKFMEYNGARNKIYKVADIDYKVVYDYAMEQLYITDFPHKFYLMAGMTENQLLAYPAMEDIFYEDLEYFTSRDTKNVFVSNYPVIRTDDVEQLNTASSIGIDSETDNKDLRRITEIACVSVASSGDADQGGSRGAGEDSKRPIVTTFNTRSCLGAPVGERSKEAQEEGQGRRPNPALAALLLSDKRKIAHNLKYDYHVIRKLGYEIKGPFGDTKMLLHLLKEHWPEKDLKTSLRHFLPEFPEHDRDLQQLKRMHNITDYTALPDDILFKYCEGDVVGTVMLHDLLYDKLTEKQKELYNLECSFMEVLLHMEENGIYVSKAVWKTLSSQLTAEIEELETELKAIADINWGSQVQVKDFLKLPNNQAATLEQHKHTNPAIPLLLKLKKLRKLYSTYVEKVGEYCTTVDEDYGRMSYELVPEGTRSGRLSSRNPNMQNIPRGSVVREMFVSRFPNGVLGEIDVSQVEYRMMAYHCQDPILLKAYQDGSDMHQATADLFRCDRQTAKTLNFALLYGASAWKLTKVLEGISQREAKEFIKRYYSKYGRLLPFINNQKQVIKDKGFVESIFGRIRHLGFSDEPKTLAHMQRAGLNTLIQGAAVDYVKASLIMSLNALRQNNMIDKVKMMVTVHDSVLIDCASEEDFHKAYAIIKDAFENPNRWSVPKFGVKFNIPFTVDAKIGPNWRELSEID